MQKFRRVVTGVGADGKAHITSDGPMTFLGGSGDAETGVAYVWAIDSTPTVPTDGNDQATPDRSFRAPAGGSRFLIGTFEPGFGMVAPEAEHEADPASGPPDPAGLSIEEMRERTASTSPSIERLIMHATPTLDYATVISGEVELVLDSGEVVKLGPSDSVVQNGTMHGWRNSSDQPVVIAFTMLGAHTA